MRRTHATGVVVLALLLAFADGGRSATACTSDTDCSDAAYCNGHERCVEGECVAGVAPPIDDNIECTDDRCDELQDRVFHTPLHHRCSDGLFCNGRERCQPLVGCRPGNPFPLEDGIDCTLDRCDEVNDVIIHNPIDVLCHDGNECTLDLCDPTSGCTSSPVEGTCDDRKPCTADDRCLDGICIGEPSTCGDGELREGCSEECDDGNGWNWDGCNALCRFEGIPRLAFTLPWILEALEDFGRNGRLSIEERGRLARARARVAKALWWIVRPDPVMYPVAPALAELSRALGELQGLDSGSPELRVLVARMVSLPRTIALQRLSVVDCVDARCEREHQSARRLVRRARKWELRGALFQAADRYKDAWAWLDGQP